MKKGTHPTYYSDAVITCACGNRIITGSTAKDISIEICSNCHPFYTGRDKLVDTAGRVDRFMKLVGKKSDAAKTRIGRKAKKAKSDARKITEAKTKDEK